MTRLPVRAIVWDFDNTLADTRARNRSVTRRIVAELTGRDPDEFAALRDQAAYDRATQETQDWQALYRIHFALDADRIRRAGRLWTACQRTDPTPIRWFDGVTAAVEALSAWPQAIVSMNTRDHIRLALAEAGLGRAFEVVVGCEEVRARRQKPDPDGLLQCLQRITPLDRGTAFYVGDHPIDVECAENANRVLRDREAAFEVVSIGAQYGSPVEPAWPIEPRHRATSPEDVVRIVARHART